MLLLLGNNSPTITLCTGMYLWNKWMCLSELQYSSVHFICLLCSTNVLIICTYLCGSKCFLRRYLPRCPPNHIPHASSESIWILGAYQYIYIYALNICVHICVYTFISDHLCDIAWHGIIPNYIKLYYTLLSSACARPPEGRLALKDAVSALQDFPWKSNEQMGLSENRVYSQL